MSELQINAELYNYALHYSKRRSLAIQVKAGKVIVRAPLTLPKTEIIDFLQQKQQWILKKIQDTSKLTAPCWLAEERIPLFELILSLEIQRGQQSSVQQLQDKLLLTISTRVSPERLDLVKQQLVTSWYKQQALDWFTCRVQYWQDIIKVQAAEIVIGSWSSKWGYCRSDGRLGFNWRLLMAPAWIADYVALHEVCHLRYLNHSAQYWQLVSKHCASIAQAKQWLKDNQHTLII